MNPIHTLALCTVALFLKTLAVSLLQIYRRLSKRRYAYPEDAQFISPLLGAGEVVGPDLEDRAAAVWRNDHENVPIFLAMAIMYLAVGACPTAGNLFFVGFTVARVVHTISFLFKLQPWRSLAYAGGIACLLGMSWTIATAVL